MENMIIVDNMVFSFLGQLDNGIYIPSYDGNKDDNELTIIRKFLLTLINVKDVRPLVRKFAGIVSLYKVFASNSNSSEATENLLENLNPDIGASVLEQSPDDLDIGNELE